MAGGAEDSGALREEAGQEEPLRCAEDERGARAQARLGCGRPSAARGLTAWAIGMPLRNGEGGKGEGAQW